MNNYDLYPHCAHLASSCRSVIPGNSEIIVNSVVILFVLELDENCYCTLRSFLPYKVKSWAWVNKGEYDDSLENCSKGCSPPFGVNAELEGEVATLRKEVAEITSICCWMIQSRKRTCWPTGQIMLTSFNILCSQSAIFTGRNIDGAPLFFMPNHVESRMIFLIEPHMVIKMNVRNLSMVAFVKPLYHRRSHVP